MSFLNSPPPIFSHPKSIFFLDWFSDCSPYFFGSNPSPFCIAGMKEGIFLSYDCQSKIGHGSVYTVDLQVLDKYLATDTVAPVFDKLLGKSI